MRILDNINQENDLTGWLQTFTVLLRITSNLETSPSLFCLCLYIKQLTEQTDVNVVKSDSHCG